MIWLCCKLRRCVAAVGHFVLCSSEFVLFDQLRPKRFAACTPTTLLSRRLLAAFGIHPWLSPLVELSNSAMCLCSTLQGLACYLLEVFGDDAKTQGIVLGYDHRARGSLNSRRFAILTSLAMMAKGIKVYLFSRLVATPLVPFGIRHLGACAGVMVTASHNPKEDNGYKVYWANGSQIIPPHDSGIAHHIDANLQPWAGLDYKGATEQAIRSNPLCAPDNTDAVVASYINAISGSLCRHRAANGDASLPRVSIAYTAMHGVGLPFATAMFAAFGHSPFVPTPAQVEPDPSFPTVAFPNPEEGKGALKLAMETADAHGCSIILANDPDADRLAVAEWVPASGNANAGAGRQPGQPGSWRVFSGNEIGALLAHWAWTCHVAGGGTGKDAVMVASTVSSKLLASMAAVEGFTFQETLTGFKWMGNAMAEHEAAGRQVLFAFEEAIGFACGSIVRDKDGVSGAAVFAEMAQSLARAGVTCSQHLDALYKRYGYFVSNNYYLFVDDPAKTVAIFRRLRNEGHYWSRLGDVGITATRDLTTPGWDSESRLEAGKPSLPVSSGTQMITYKVSEALVHVSVTRRPPRFHLLNLHSAPIPSCATNDLAVREWSGGHPPHVRHGAQAQVLLRRERRRPCADKEGGGQNSPAHHRRDVAAGRA